MSVRPTKMEDPCVKTNKGCEYVIQESYDDFGEFESSDYYCTNCGNWRDFSKEPYTAEVGRKSK